MEFNNQGARHVTEREASGRNQTPGGAYRRIARRSLLPDPPAPLVRSDPNQAAVFRPLPRDVVRAFTGKTAPPPRFVILLPVDASDLWKAMNLAVVLGRSLRYLPEVRARDELVLNVETESYHHAFCDLVLPGDLECSKPCGHDGDCEAL